MERGKLKNNEIQREQLQLVRIQTELEGILVKVNETINALKVEELQLKSSAVAAMNIKPPPPPTDSSEDLQLLPGTSARAAKEAESVPAKQQFEESVNQQEIDLGMFLPPVKGGDMEEEEDDEDME